MDSIHFVIVRSKPLVVWQCMFDEKKVEHLKKTETFTQEGRYKYIEAEVNNRSLTAEGARCVKADNKGGMVNRKVKEKETQSFQRSTDAERR